MDKLSPAILEAFGIHGQPIKKEKGRFVCDTTEGLGIIHTTYEPTEAIVLRHSVKEHLAEKGFPWTDRYRPTTTGSPYILIGRETYVMTLCPRESRETDFENEKAILQAFEFLARFHIAAVEMPGLLIPHMPPMVDVYSRQLGELAQAGKQARRGPRMLDFDVLFIKHSPHYIQAMEDSISHLAKTDYAKLYGEAIRRGSLCHNSLKEENLLATSDATYLINFTETAFGPQISDLAALVRRYAQRSSKSIPVGCLLEAYDRINPLPDGVGDILYPLLIFPWAFTKIATQYYSKKRNWTPGGLISRMEALLAGQESYEKYVMANA